MSGRRSDNVRLHKHATCSAVAAAARSPAELLVGCVRSQLRYIGRSHRVVNTISPDSFFPSQNFDTDNMASCRSTSRSRNLAKIEYLGDGKTEWFSLEIAAARKQSANTYCAAVADSIHRTGLIALNCILPRPRRLCFCLCVVVCLSVCQLDDTKSYRRILAKYFGWV